MSFQANKFLSSHTIQLCGQQHTRPCFNDGRMQHHTLFIQRNRQGSYTTITHMYVQFGNRESSRWRPQQFRGSKIIILQRGQEKEDKETWDGRIDKTATAEREATYEKPHWLRSLCRLEGEMYLRLGSPQLSNPRTFQSSFPPECFLLFGGLKLWAPCQPDGFPAAEANQKP